MSYAKCRKIGVETFETCRVPHFNISYAASMIINGENPFKLTYSGDTKCSNDLVLFGQNSTLLIHEATYPDRFIKAAVKNRHCTISQAIEQSEQMNAKYTILTHFSQYYVNSFPSIDTKKNKNIGIAFDNMELIEADLPKLSNLYEQYSKLVRNKIQWKFSIE